MNLGELKKSLSRFPPDMDDTEVLLHYVDENGELDADCVAFVAVASFPPKDTAALLIGSWKAADKMKEIYPDQFPADWKPRPEIKPKNQNKETNEES